MEANETPIDWNETLRLSFREEHARYVRDTGIDIPYEQWEAIATDLIMNGAPGEVRSPMVGESAYGVAAEEMRRLYNTDPTPPPA